MGCLFRTIEAPGRPVGGIATGSQQLLGAPTPRAPASVGRGALARSTGPSA